MSNMIFLPEGWGDYLYWHREDKRTLRKINQLLADISRNAYNGLGKPICKTAYTRIRTELPTTKASHQF